MNQIVPWIPWLYLVGKLCWVFEGRFHKSAEIKKQKQKQTHHSTSQLNDGTNIEISDIVSDTVVPFTKDCLLGKPNKSKRAQLKYFVTLQTGNALGYLVVCAVMELVIIMFYYTNMINHFTA